MFDIQIPMASVGKCDNSSNFFIFLKEIWLKKKYLEYIHNIEYSTYPKFQSVWINTDEDIPTGQKVGPAHVWGHVSMWS